MSKWSKRLIIALVVLVASGGAGYYWLFVDSSPPSSGAYAIDMAEVRRLASSIPGDKVTEIRNEHVATYKTQIIRDWLAKRPRWHAHFTPTSASWINQVERFFALLTERQIRRGVHRNLDALHQAITSFVDRHNASPKPFRWTKSANDILASVERFCIRNMPERTSGSGRWRRGQI